MTNRLIAWSMAAVAIAGLVASARVRAMGQAPAASARAVPRTAEGTPDFSGIWQVINTANWNIQDHAASLGVPGGIGVVEGDDLPYTPAAAAKKKQNFDNRKSADPVAQCFMAGVPRSTYLPFPFQMFQTPQLIAIVYEFVHSYRPIYLTGAKHFEDGDFWMGHSIGHWEGDTLVVDVANFNDQTWFDQAGNFHSDALHVVERYSFIDRNTLNYDVTIEDPKVFTRPWKMSMPIHRRIEKGMQLAEYECYAYADEEGGKRGGVK